MSFVNPWFLFGLLATAAPVLLHLIRREQAREIDFPTLMYLKRVSRKLVRFQMLRHLLLLLLRIAALALIALAFTRPFRVLPAATAGSGQAAATTVILLDDSMSMAYERRWERAKARAAEIARSTRPGDRAALVTFSDKSTIVVPPTGDAGIVAAALGGLQVSDRATRFGQALRTAERVAIDAGSTRKVLHLISDFQRNGAAAEDQLFRAGSGIEIRAEDVGEDDYSNLAFGEVKVENEDAEEGQDLRVQASVVNFGNQERRELRVTVTLDGRNLEERLIDFAPGEVKPFEFKLPSLSRGAHSITLGLADSRLQPDNRFLLTVESRGRLPVFGIEDGGNRGSRSPSFFLASALNVPSLSPYRFSTIASDRLQSTKLPPGALVVWNNVVGAAANEASSRLLKDAVAAGTGLCIVVAEPASSEAFNRVFGSWLPVHSEAASRPAGRGGRDSAGYSLLTDIRTDHPMFTPFSEPNSGTFSSARFLRHARLRAEKGAEVLARFDNGDPAVVIASHGQGRAVVLGFSADDSGNDLPLRSVYAAFWHQLLRTIQTGERERRWYEVGQTIAPRALLEATAALRGLDVPSAGDNLVVLDPQKSRVPVSAGGGSAELEHAGFHDVRTAALNTVVAVNPVPRESDLARGNPDEMAASWMTVGTPQSAPAPDERPTPEEVDRRQGIWRYLLLAAVLAIVGEGLLAGRLSPKAG